jgi:hypothetical protein
MTDRDEPRGDVPEVTPLDELASALLDGEATIEERARADDPEITARVARFGEVASVVGSEVEPPTDAERDAAIAAALDAWDEQVSGAGRPRVDELAERRDRSRRMLRLVGVAAAALAVVGLGAALVDRLPDGGDDDAGVAVEASGGEAEGSDEATAETEAADDSGAAEAPATESGPQTGEFTVDGDDLGRFEELDDLLFESAARLAAGAGSDAGAALEPDAAVLEAALACAPTALPTEQTVSALGGATVLRATLDTREVLVFALPTADGPRVVVVDAETCEVLADRTP